MDYDGIAGVLRVLRDDETRTLAKRLRDRAVVVGLSSDEAEAEGQMMAAGDIQGALIDRIGQLVREMDEADSPPRQLDTIRN